MFAQGIRSMIFAAFSTGMAHRSPVGPGSSGQDSISRLMRRAFQSAAKRKSLLEKG